MKDPWLKSGRASPNKMKSWGEKLWKIANFSAVRRITDSIRHRTWSMNLMLWISGVKKVSSWSSSERIGQIWKQVVQQRMCEVHMKPRCEAHFWMNEWNPPKHVRSRWNWNNRLDGPALTNLFAPSRNAMLLFRVSYLSKHVTHIGEASRSAARCSAVVEKAGFPKDCTQEALVWTEAQLTRCVWCENKRCRKAGFSGQTKGLVQ